MKKILLGVFALAALASCSKNDVVENTAESRKISFNTLNDKVTRAATSNDDNYVVYATNVVSGANFMNGVEFNGAGTDIDKPVNSGSFFWPSDALDFIAYAPKQASGVTYNNLIGTGSSLLEIIFMANPGADVDLTAAKTLNQDKTTNAGTVALNFQHLLAKVTIDIVLADDLIASGHDFSIGSTKFSVNATAGQFQTNSFSWTAVNTPGDHSILTSKSPSFMILPSASTNAEIALMGVEVKKGNEVLFTNKNLTPYVIAAGDLPVANGDEFKMGLHYKIKLTITSGATDPTGPVFPDVINFTSSVDATWGTPVTPPTDVTQP